MHDLKLASVRRRSVHIQIHAFSRWWANMIDIIDAITQEISLLLLISHSRLCFKRRGVGDRRENSKERIWVLKSKSHNPFITSRDCRKRPCLNIKPRYRSRRHHTPDVGRLNYIEHFIFSVENCYYLRIENAEGYVLIAMYLFLFIFLHFF